LGVDLLRLRQGVAKQCARAVEARLGSRYREVQAASDLLEREVCVIVKKDWQPIGWVELSQRVHEDRVVGGRRRRRAGEPGVS
jgi:hypothetical protein